MNDSHSNRVSAVIGSLCLLLGFALGVVVLSSRLDADWGFVGRAFARNPVFSWGIAVGLMFAGAIMIKRAPQQKTAWSPRCPGRRFQHARLYTRDSCPLCDEARRTLEAYHTFLPPLEEIDIDSLPELRQNFGTCVPVVELDGRVRFRGHVNEVLLQRLLEGTPPSPQERST